MAAFHLQPSDARLVSLALVYHLGRPGSETDPATLQPHDLGLAAVRDALDPQLEALREGTLESPEPPESPEVVALELSPYQVTRLGVALHGVVNELKQFGMAGGRSAVPGFADAFARLHAEAGADAESGGPAHDPLAPDLTALGPIALDLVPDAVMLRRRLDDAVREAERQVAAARASQAQTGAATGHAPLWRRLLQRLRRRAAGPRHRCGGDGQRRR